MNKKLKGFSLAELLISLLIISIVLSAAIPTITRKAANEREFIWRWSNEGNNAYYGTGSNQTAIIGLDDIPMNGSDLDDIMVDQEADDDTSTDDTNRKEIDVVNIQGLNFSNDGDKLSILKKTVQSDSSNFMNSHISFYTLSNNAAVTTSDIQYGGRLAMDAGNIALGIGALQSISESNPGENTAIGHFALLRDSDGYRNTAVGKKSLSYNQSGSYNTAVGFGSLYTLGKDSSSGTDAYFENTAIGALSQQHNSTGQNNTSLGSQSLKKNVSGNGNTVVGQLAMMDLTSGNNNTSIGTQACRYITTGTGNICIGYLAGNSSGLTTDNYGVYIGSGSEAPLISGHSQKTDSDDKEFIVNAKNVIFQPYNAAAAIFHFEQLSGTDGYGAGASTAGNSGKATFGLRDTRAGVSEGSSDSSSVYLAFTGLYRNDRRIASIQGYDPYTSGDSDILFNGKLTLGFPQSDSEANISIKTYADSIPLVLNDKVTIAHGTNTGVINMDTTGIIGIYTDKDKSNSYSYLSLAKTNDSVLKMHVDSAKSLYFSPTNGIQVTTPGKITLTSSSADSAISFGSSGASVTISNSQLYFNALKANKFVSNEGNLLSIINAIYTQVQDIAELASDERLKNISGDSTAGLKEINQLQVKNYTYKKDKEKKPHVGVIAQQLMKIFPNSVIKDDEGYYRISKEEIFFAMVNSIKELFAKIQDLTAKITGLDKRITELEKQNKMLKEQNQAFEKRLKKLELQSSK